MQARPDAQFVPIPREARLPARSAPTRAKRAKPSAAPREAPPPSRLYPHKILKPHFDLAPGSWSVGYPKWGFRILCG